MQEYGKKVGGENGPDSVDQMSLSDDNDMGG